MKSKPVVAVGAILLLGVALLAAGLLGAALLGNRSSEPPKPTPPPRTAPREPSPEEKDPTYGLPLEITIEGVPEVPQKIRGPSPPIPKDPQPQRH